MSTVKFMVVDMIRSKKVLWFLVFFTVISWVMMRSVEKPMAAMVYMVFVAIIFSNQPFLMDQRFEAGFLELLPGTKAQRVWGRYLYGAILLAVCVLLGAAVTCLGDPAGARSSWLDVYVTAALGIAMVVQGLQYPLMYYAMRKMKSRELFSVLMMAPGFLIFFFGLNLIDYIGENGAGIFLWALDHIHLLGVLLLAAGILVWIAGAFISVAIVKKNDI